MKKFEPFAVKIKLADGTEADATVAPTEAPSADLTARVAAVETQVSGLATSVTDLTQRVGTVESSLVADDGVAEVPADEAATPAPMKAVRSFSRNHRKLSSGLKNLADQFTELREKLGRRMGLEFAARAGANPLENPVKTPVENKHIFDQYSEAEGGEKTRLLRAHRTEILAEGRRRQAGSILLKPLLALALLVCIVLAAARGQAVLAVNLAFVSAAALAGTSAFRRGQLGAAPDTIDIVSSLNLDLILDSSLQAFKRAVLPLRMFSTVFNNVQLKGTDIIDVPYYPLQGIASKTFNGTYDFSTGAGAKLDIRQITVNKRKYQPLAMTSAQVARLPSLSADKIGQLKGEKLAFDVIQDILSIVTAANFPSVAFTGAASTFDGDDVVDIRTLCNKNTTGVASVANGVTTDTSTTVTSATADFSFSDIGAAISGTGIPASTTIAGVTNATTATLSAAATATATGITFTLTRPTIPWPETGRGLLVNPDYDGALFKDANFRRDYTVAEGAVMVKEAQLPRIYGFEYGQSAAIPTNSENLVGMAAYQSAILTAFSPIEPADGGRIVDYRIVTDPDTDISIEYRKWFSPDTDTLKEVIECNYGYNYGERLALKRLKSA